MGTRALLNLLARLLGDRWQVPVALAAAIMGGVALFRLIPAPVRLSVDSLLADVSALEQAGDVTTAADAINSLLEQESPLPPEQQAMLHDRLADLICRAERHRDAHNRANANSLLEHSRRARELGRGSSPAVALREALAHQWLGQDEVALRGLRAALEAGLPGEERQVASEALVRMLETRPDAEGELRQVLSDVLDDENLSPARVWWALRRAVQDALAEGNVAQARELLGRYGDRLKSSDLRGYLEYLWAWVMLREGRPEEAEPVVQWVDDWLGQRTKTTSTREPDELGHLPSLNRCLLGQVLVATGRPQEALEAFEQTLRWYPEPAAKVAIAIGRAQALAALHEEQTSREAFRAALDSLYMLPDYEQRTRLELRTTLRHLSDERQLGGDFPDALAYLAMADEATDAQLGRSAARGEAQDSRDDGRADLVDPMAWRNLERAANVLKLDETRLTTLLWSAIEEYERAGRLTDLGRALHWFVDRRMDHQRMPQALLWLGQVCERNGAAEDALTWYARVGEQYPELEEAGRAKVLMARALISLGPEHYPDAEGTLANLLTDGRVAPDAGAYREGLLALSDLLCCEGRYGEAVGRLEEFEALYPDDRDRLRVRFTLANAHRRSAYALRDNPPSETSAEASAAESRSRFRAAAGLYAALVSDFDAAPPSEDSSVAQASSLCPHRQDAGATAIYARLSLLYEGDCLFELNDCESLQAALRTYSLAGARYAGQPAALAARVQIANVHLRLGDVPNAARALDGAVRLLRGMPDGAFVRGGSDERAVWERFLSVVLSSDPFRELLVAAR